MRGAAPRPGRATRTSNACAEHSASRADHTRRMNEHLACGPHVAAAPVVVHAQAVDTPDAWCLGTSKPPFCSAVRGDRASGWPAQSRSEVMARNGLVVTSQPLAAQAGLAMLARGGNAIDAAV